jgi:hypothetical protein
MKFLQARQLTIDRWSAAIARQKVFAKSQFARSRNFKKIENATIDLDSADAPAQDRASHPRYLPVDA